MTVTLTVAPLARDTPNFARGCAALGICGETFFTGTPENLKVLQPAR